METNSIGGRIKDRRMASEHGLYRHAQQGFNGFPLAALAAIGEHNCPENLTWINA